MGIFRVLTKAGVAKKVISEARKPENQRRIKSAIASFRNRGGKSGPPPRGS